MALRVPSLSVVIPTYNRKDSLLRTLESLQDQTLSAALYEVIIVDDGSTDGTGQVAEGTFPFVLNYIHQVNSGDAQARNTGVHAARGDFLVFVDDDVTLERACLSTFLRALQGHPRAVVVGSLRPVVPESSHPFHQFIAGIGWRDLPVSDNGQVSFTACLSGFMAIRRSDYFAIGMMHGLNRKGANAWCDVDFAYRAHTMGYSFYVGAGAIGYHDDDAVDSLSIACARSERVSRRAPTLFRTHPDLFDSIPMFRDKAPIAWRHDPLGLIGRKLARGIASSRPVVWVMERLVRVLERHCPSCFLLHLLYRWIISAYIFRGYRLGLGDVAQDGRVGP
jgi:glycosyltransferase involved in cell wall biosynthesis